MGLRARPGISGQHVVDGEISVPAYVVAVEHRGDCVDDVDERQVARAERLDADLVRGVVHRRRGAALLPRPACEPYGGKGVVVEREELPGLRTRPVDRWRHIGQPVGPAQAERDRDQHGRRAGLHQRGAVGELDHRVHDAGRVDDHLDAVEGDAEEQVRLDHLEALVHQGGRVDRHDRTHVPRRVGQRFVDRDLGQLLAGAAPERSTAGREHEASYLVGAAASQALGQRTVLAVDRDDLPGLRARSDHGSADDQRLLVGQGEGVARVERSQRGAQPHGTGHRVEHHVARRTGRLGGGILAQPGVRRSELGDLLLEELLLRPPGRQPDHPEPVRVGAHHVEGLGAHRPGRTEDDDVAALTHALDHRSPHDPSTAPASTSPADPSQKCTQTPPSRRKGAPRPRRAVVQVQRRLHFCDGSAHWGCTSVTARRNVAALL